jgi:hypothetical protein
MALTTPDWLARHGGEARPSKDPRSTSVYFDAQLQYVLVAVPARGKFACRITQTINGQRLDSGTVHPTAEAALVGGLEDLRVALGW